MPRPVKNPEILTVRPVDPELIDEVRRLAAEERRTMYEIVSEALEEYLAHRRAGR